MDFTGTSPASDWKWLGCNMCWSQWKDTSSNASMLRIATFAYPHLEFSYMLQEINQRCFLLSEQLLLAQIFHHMKGTPTGAPLKEAWFDSRIPSFMYQENAKCRTELVCTIRVKEPFHKHHKQEFGIFTDQLHHQIREHTQPHCEFTQEINPCFFHS